jgi:hypothetical protein
MKWLLIPAVILSYGAACSAFLKLRFALIKDEAERIESLARFGGN